MSQKWTKRGPSKGKSEPKHVFVSWFMESFHPKAQTGAKSNHYFHTIFMVHSITFLRIEFQLLKWKLVHNVWEVHLKCGYYIFNLILFIDTWMTFGVQKWLMILKSTILQRAPLCWSVQYNILNELSSHFTPTFSIMLIWFCGHYGIFYVCSVFFMFFPNLS